MVSTSLNQRLSLSVRTKVRSFALCFHVYTDETKATVSTGSSECLGHMNCSLSEPAVVLGPPYPQRADFDKATKVMTLSALPTTTTLEAGSHYL